MSINKQKIIDSYSAANEKDRAETAGIYGMEFLYTKKYMSEFINTNTDVAEIGCGGGYYGFYFSDKCKSYLGVDITPINVEEFKKAIKKNNLTNVRAEIGDAIKLNHIDDCKFDVVMCLGPMYHLNRDDRCKCISECKRICKNGGIVSFAYINKTGVILKFGNILGWENVLTDKIGENVIDKGIDDVRPDLFFYTMPEEISSDAANAGLNIVKNVGLDVLMDDKAIEQLSDSQRQVWFKLAKLLNESPSCVGISNHALLICRK